MTETTKLPTPHNADSTPPWDAHLRVLPLPPESRDCDVRLQAVAARLLQLAHVRSVSIDGNRTEAVIRLHAARPIDPGIDDLATCLTSDSPVADAPRLTPLPKLVSWADPASGNLYFIKLPAQVHGWRKALLLVAAGFWLFLGLIGVILPGLPTTPFVLLASYCLLRTSPALHERLLHSRLFGGVLRDWHLHRGIRPHVRTKAVVLVALVVAISLALTSLPLPAKLVIAALAAYGIYYIWRLPSVAE